MNQFYVYQYLDQDNIPYYVGKGKGRRAYEKHIHVDVPVDRSRIIFVADQLAEEDALALEMALIESIGRVSLGTGPLLNRSAGGENASAGSTRTAEHRRRISEANKGKHIPIESRSSIEGYIARYGVEQGTQLYTEHSAKKDSMSLGAFVRRYGEDGERLYQEHCSAQSSRIAGEKHHLFGIGHKEETKQKISASKTGKKIARSAEHNAKIAAARKGQKPPQDTCPHCGLTTSANLIKRWHRDNCKHK